MQFLTSLKSVAEHYDLFIIDLWGVIHDGRSLYPTSKDCLIHLRQANKKIVFLSNAPRRASVVAAALQQMGITNDLYDRIVTSGETFFQLLAHPEKAPFRLRSKNYLYMGLERDSGVIHDLPYKETKNADEAAFLLLSHSDYDNQPMQELMPRLQACLKNKLPALCINPDREIVRLDGTHVMCAGIIAEEYEKMGGEALYFGKPHAKVYEASLNGFEHIDHKRILAIGDSLGNDIAGANNHHITSILVTGGILNKSVASHAADTHEEKLKEILEGGSIKPDFVLPAFVW